MALDRRSDDCVMWRAGLGEATARHLAAKGHRVVLGARRTNRLEKLAAEIRAAGGTAEYRALDVTNLADMQAFAEFALKRFSKIDVIINNAGVMPLSPLAELKIDEWNRMIDVNIRGVLHGIAASAPSRYRNVGLKIPPIIAAPVPGGLRP